MSLEKFVTHNGRVIYRFPVQSFPVLKNFIHVISDGEKRFLVDCGSGMPQSNEDLLAGLAAINDTYEPLTLADIDALILTHGHIDHFGGLSFVRQHSQAPAGIHQLDVRVISHHEERRIVASRQLEIFLEKAGVSERKRQDLMAMYLFSKDSLRAWPIDFILSEEQPYHDIHFIHTPGHCSGQVCLLVDDVMITADHILSHTTPHQAPESITMNMGLGHYLDSLTKVKKIPHIRLGLGGHEEAMTDVYGRIEAIRQAHQKRLERILEICHTPKTIAEVSHELFGPRHSYHVLLAIEEAGAHVEYLYERGELIAANVEEIAQTPHPVIYYQRP